jgi:hypothetical protein
MPQKPDEMMKLPNFYVVYRDILFRMFKGIRIIR